MSHFSQSIFAVFGLLCLVSNGICQTTGFKELTIIVDNFFKSDLAFFNTQIDQFNNTLTSECQQNNVSDNSVPDFKEVFANFHRCAISEIDSESVVTVSNLITHIQNLIREKNIIELETSFDSYCKFVDNLLKCGLEQYPNIKPCVDTDDLAKFNQALKIFTNAKQLICANKGKDLASFFAHNGFDCLNKTFENISDCLLAEYPIEKTSEFSDVLERPCPYFKTASTCIQSEVDQCENFEITNVTKSFLDNMKNKFECKDAAIAAHPIWALVALLPIFLMVEKNFNFLF